MPEPGEPRLVTSKSQDMWAAPASRYERRVRECLDIVYPGL